MCTATWNQGEGGYALFFNRDERRARKPATPPRVREKGSLRFIAPADGDFGGTWIAVSERGLSLALLNGYQSSDDAPAEPPGGYTSRGFIVPALIDSHSPGQALARLARHDLKRFRSFWLAAFETGGRNRLARWDGSSLETEALETAAMPLVSSSFDTLPVRRSRRELFARMAGRAGDGDEGDEGNEAEEMHLTYHASHAPERGPYSTCMHRPDARTVSFNWIRVDAERVRFDYAPHPPCLGRPPGPSVELARVEGVSVDPGRTAQ